MTERVREKEFSEVREGISYRYQSEWINQLERQDHWLLYWFQQKMIQSVIKAPSSILEIGIGSGFTSNYLKSKGHQVDTLDIDKNKRPDIVANLVSYDFPKTYDHVLAFEVFEHIPFSEFEKILSKLKHVVKENIILSIPKNEYSLTQMLIKLPFFKIVNFEISLPKFRITEPYHFWEVGHGKITEKHLKETINKHSFKIINIKKYQSRYFIILRND